MKHTQRRRAAAVALCLLAWCAATRAEVLAQLERNAVQLGEIVTLSITSDDPRSGGQPDLTPLRKDFAVLGTSSSSQTSYINGRRSQLQQWLVRLRARRTGTLGIPPIKVGNEQTQALTLQVDEVSAQAAAATARHVFLEVEAAPAASRPIYVQQQIAYTVRLYYDGSIQGGELGAPDGSDAMVQQIGDDQHYTALRNGREYKVIERRYAIAPEKSGALRIAGPSFSGTALVAGDGAADPANDMLQRMLRNTPFANDPAFRLGLPFGQQPQPVAASSAALTLDVRARPVAAKTPWLPAEQITLHDSWQDHPPQFKVGEPVTRVITIEARGLAARQIPPLTLPAPDNARVYPETADDQSRSDGTTIHGTSRQSLTYIPNAPGRLELAPVELAWWNTELDVSALAVLPARQYDVAPAPAGVADNTASTQASAQGATPAKPSTTQAQRPDWPALLRARLPMQLQSLLHAHGVWAAAGLALLALLIAVASVLRRRSAAAGAASTKAPGKRTGLQALRRACAANDSRAAASALLALARSEWPQAPPAGLSALAARLDAGAEQVRELERSLYAAGTSAWDGAALYGALRHGLRARHEHIAAIGEDDDLRPLYR